MSVETQLFVGWVLFGGTHIVGSSVPVRTRLIRALGLSGFKGVYSLVALATLTPLVWIYWNNRHEGEMLFDPAWWTRRATEAVMLVGMLFLVLGFASPSPATTSAEMGGKLVSSARGIHRVTRHPMNTAFGLFGIAHLLTNPTVGDWVFWGGFVVYALLSAIHQDRRLLASGPAEFKPFYAETSLIPFVAILRGRQRLRPGELGWGPVGLAVAVFFVIRWIHPVVIGGFR